MEGEALYPAVGSMHSSTNTWAATATIFRVVMSAPLVWAEAWTRGKEYASVSLESGIEATAPFAHACGPNA